MKLLIILLVLLSGCNIQTHKYIVFEKSQFNDSLCVFDLHHQDNKNWQWTIIDKCHCFDVDDVLTIK
jgi:hypothetical protein